MKCIPIFIVFCLISSLLSCSSQKKIVSGNRMANNFPTFDKEGHRGSRGLMPENTIPAMHKAIDLGVTTLEMDVLITRDRKVVVSHDPYFNADITTTPDGRTITKQEGAELVLYRMDYEQIKRYDVGSKAHPLFPRQHKVKVHKPLLSELLQSTEGYTKSKALAPLWYNIETKSKPSGDGLQHPSPEEFVDLVVAVIQQEGISERTIIQSFDPRTLQVVHRKYPNIKTSLLIEATDKRDVSTQLKELGFTPFVYSPNYNLLTPALVNLCHQKGMKVVPWTINTADAMKQAINIGVDGIITDYPDLFNDVKL